MATVEVQVVSEEIEKVVTENIVNEMHSRTVTEALVALPTENNEASVHAKENSSADSGILMNKSSSGISNSSNGKDSEEGVFSSQSSVEENLTGTCSSIESEPQLSQGQNKLSLDSTYSQKSKASSYSSKSSSSLTSKSISSVKRSQSVNNENEDSRSSISSSSTVKASQQTNDRSDDECNSRSSFRSSGKKNSPEKQSDSQSTLKRSQSVSTNLSDDEDSRSTIVSSNSRSTTKNSQPINDKSDDEENSRSSLKLKKSTPKKENVNKKQNKYFKIVDSDSEDDILRSKINDKQIDTDLDSTISDNTQSSKQKSKTKHSQPINDKFNDEDNSRFSFKSKKSTPEQENENKKSNKYFKIIDSDSEDDIILTSKINDKQKDTDSDSTITQSSQSSKRKSKVKNKKQLIDSDSDEEIDKNKENKFGSENDSSDNENTDSQPAHKSNKISNIIDADDESDSDNRSQNGGNISSEEENDSRSAKKNKKSEKTRTGSARASKDAAMQQIHSETQRLIRESHLSLPYHKPKQRTLEEFLNRKKMTSVIPKNLTCAEKVKMFSNVISKVVEEKEKEAEIFYKSSDSEEDEKDEPMEIDLIDAENKNQNEIEKKSNTINITDTQILSQDHIQDVHNKREILQRRSADFGVPRKLFMEDKNDIEETDNVKISEECLEDENSDPNITAMKKKSREGKTGLRESSIPRKLFTNGTEEMDVDMDMNTNENSKQISEKQVEDNVSSSENSHKITGSFKNKTALDDSTEEFSLKLPDSELHTSSDKKTVDLNKIDNMTDQNKDQENMMISETPVISNKELLKSNEESNKYRLTENSSKESSDAVLKLVKETLDENEIIDHKVLREDFGRLPELDEPVKKPSLKEQILANALKIKPMIKASPGSVIDFTSSEQLKEGVTKLLERFARHSAVHKPKTETVSEVKIMRTEGSGDDIKIVEEIIPFNKTIAIEDDPKKECKPGEKLKKLREDLKRKIAIARDEEWRQKEEHENEDEEVEEKKGKDDDFYKDLPDEEEMLEDEESAESEPEEDDMPIVESRRKTCKFGDEEAEESDDEDEEEEAEENEEEEEEENDDTEIEDQEDEDKEIKKPKKLKRIVRPFDEEDESSQSIDAEAKLTLDRTKTDEDMFASQASKGSASDPDDIPPFQLRDRCYSDSRSQTCKTPLPKPTNPLSMISPVAQLTALNTSLDSAKKSASKTTTFNFNSDSTENTPSVENRSKSNCNLEKMNSLQKKLFEDPPNSVHDSELLEVCSGKFTETQDSQQIGNNSQSHVTDSQIIDICSGAFATQAGNVKKALNSEQSVNEIQNRITDSQLMDICSGAFPTQSDNVNFKHPNNIQSGVSDSQIMDICSGAFLTQTDKAEKHKIISPNLLVQDETSQDIRLTLDDDEDSKSPSKMSSSMKRSDESMFSSDSKSPDLSSAVTATTNTITTGSSSSTTTTTTTTTTTIIKRNPMEAWLQKATKLIIAQDQQKKQEVSNTQLMDLCSGAFPSQSEDLKNSEKDGASHIQNETSQDFRLTLDDDSNSPTKKSLPKQKSKESEVSSKHKIVEENEEPKATWSKLRIASSSDEDDVKTKAARPKKKVLKRKKVQKLSLSDDEDENPKEFSDEEESEIEVEEDEEKFVDYDSDENEIVVVSKKEIKKVAAKYLENEAELSESEWGSADEDEQDLDKLEYEEGDAEDIDEKKVKDQLDKIHMQQVMDEDQREVRMLQELLFDDGDLHSEGAGRERRFKWKNIDDIGDDELKPRTDDDGDVLDDEVDTTVELQMRKMRYEQQKFLEEKGKNIENGMDDDFGGGKLLKGLKVVTVRSSSKNSIEEQKVVKSSSTDLKSITVTNNLATKKTFMSSKSLSFSNMKGSFLSRGDETLVRIAQNLPETKKLSLNAGRKGKFVFAHLSPSVSKEPQVDSEQENDNTPAKEKDKTRKRKMFSSQSSQTPRTSKKAKVEDRARGKKLF